MRVFTTDDNPRDVLEEVCHTSTRVHNGRLYTLADDGHAGVSGRQIRVTFNHSQWVYAWDAA